MEMDKTQNSFEDMFEYLWENRKDDLIRAVEARKQNERRPLASKRLISYYRSKVGKRFLARGLSKKELAELKETWKDIWDLGVIEPDWYSIYKEKTGVFDPEFIGSDLHYFYTEWIKIDFDYLRGFLDKNYGDIILPCIRHPETIVRKIHGYYRDSDFKHTNLRISVDKIYAMKEEGAVIKVSRVSSGGEGVSFVTADDTRKSIEEKLATNKDLIVQSVIRQHKDMARMNPSSVNSVRVITIMLDGESIPLSTVVRIGREGSRVDNFSAGGFAVGVNPDGSLKDIAYDGSGKKYKRHPNGFVWSEGKIPNYDKVIEAVKKCHSYVPIFGVVSWDIAISEEGEPILIEYNVSQGQIDFHQYCNGPVYGKYRESIIKDVFSFYQIRNGNMKYNYSLKKGECKITAGSKMYSEMLIPETIEDTPVTSIDDEVFSNSKELRQLIIDASLKNIGAKAFFRCQQLEDIVFNGTVEELGDSCFESCQNLENVTIPEGTRTIRARAFGNCQKLKRIYIPESVDNIDKEVFTGSPRVTIECLKDSEAHKYAEENHIRYRLR